MRRGRVAGRDAALVLVGLAASAYVATGAFADPPENLISHADFDYYELTLSWSPGFCDTPAGQRSPEQCAAGAGSGFVVHGLWPDNFDRPYPQFCGGEAASQQALAATRGVFPTPGLAASEYEKHGTCTGLGAENYFNAAKYVRDQFAIPEMLRAPTARVSISASEIESAFIAVNPNLTAASMTVTCSRDRELLDVRFCVAKTLDGYVNCPKVAGHVCRAPSISVPPPR
jgi:ribonuclease T2